MVIRHYCFYCNVVNLYILFESPYSINKLKNYKDVYHLALVLVLI